MRGQTPLPIPVPLRGLIRNVPLQEIPPDAVVDGSNMYIDVDGFWKPRPGYAPRVAIGPGGRIMGGIEYVDADGVTVQQVAANLTQWWWLNTGTGLWVNITGTANAGNADNQSRFITFPQDAPMHVYVIGVNNVDAMRRWKSGDPAYTTIAAAPGGADIAVIIDRVVVVNTIEAGSRFSSRVRWSAVNDATTWPALAFNDLVDSDDPIVGIHKLGRSAAAIYTQSTIWLMVAQSGSDATAFRFEQIPSVVVGPCGPAAIVEADGIHYYLGRDLRVHRFDGVTEQVVSKAIDPVIVADADASFYTRYHGVYSDRLRSIIWLYVPVGSSDPTHALVFNLDTAAILPIWTFPEGFTASWRARGVQGVDWSNWVAVGIDWNTVPFSNWSDIGGNVTRVANVGSAAGQIHDLGNGPTDNGAAIAYSWKTALFQADPSSVLLPDRVDLFMNPSTISETVKMTVSRLTVPNQTPEFIKSWFVDVANLPDYTAKVTPDIRKGGPYLQLAFEGSSQNAVVSFGGGTLLVHPEQRA